MYRTNECIFGVLYGNQKRFIDESKGANSPEVSRRDSIREKQAETIDSNLRGLNISNLFKRVVWSCVTHRNSELDDTSEVNLPLLKGLLDEISSEIYIEDFKKRVIEKD